MDLASSSCEQTENDDYCELFGFLVFWFFGFGFGVGMGFLRGSAYGVYE